MNQPRTIQRLLLAIFALLTAALFISPLRQNQPEAAEKTAEERGLYNLTHNSYDTPRLNRKLLELASKAW
ncbi:MAG: hypothetical protein AAB401_11920, partial [Acidobacteriota bacterium]